MPVKHNTYYRLNSRLLVLRWQTTKTIFFKALQHGSKNCSYTCTSNGFKHLLTIFRTDAVVTGERKVSFSCHDKDTVL